MMFEPIEDLGNRLKTPEVAGYEASLPVGAGSSATVWIAEQQRPFRRRVALKVFHSTSGSHALLERFRTERDILARLPRDGFCDIYDAGLCADGRPYLAMEFVDGEHLVDAVRKLDGIERAARLFVEVSQVIAQAHALGLVHLDLKPSNVLVETAASGAPRPRVIDFGLAGHAGDRSAGRGSRGFASPEVQQGAAASPASDVYSIAAMLRTVLEDRGDWAQSALGTRLGALVRRNLAEEPSQRARDAGVLAREIGAEIDGARRRRVVVGAMSAAAVAALGGGLAAWHRSSVRTPAPVPAPAPAPYVPVERHVPRDYPTIQAAVDASRTGDIVRVAPGIHRGPVVVENRSVSLRGLPGMAAVTVVDAGGHDGAVIGIFGGDPTRSSIRDLTITHSGIPMRTACGIGYQGEVGRPILIERCIIRDNIALSDAIPGGANLFGDAVFEACAFLRNRPGYRGAAFAVYDGCTVSAVDCCFRDHLEGSALISVRNDARASIDDCVIVGSNRLATAKRNSSIVFRHCRGSGIEVVGGTGFVDGGANCWECCVDEDGDGIVDLEHALFGEV